MASFVVAFYGPSAGYALVLDNNIVVSDSGTFLIAVAVTNGSLPTSLANIGGNIPIKWSFDSATAPSVCTVDYNGQTYHFTIKADKNEIGFSKTCMQGLSPPHYNATNMDGVTGVSTYNSGVYEIWQEVGSDVIYQIKVGSEEGNYSEEYDGNTKLISLWSSTNNGTTYSQVNTDVTWYRNGSEVPSGSVSVGKVYEHDKNVCSETISAVVSGESVASINFEITAKTVFVSGTVVNNKTYDGNTNAMISSGNYGSLVNAVSGDDVYISAVTGTFASSSAGKNKTVTLTYTLAGQDVGNYVNPVTGTATANILHRVEFGIVGFTPRYTTASTVTKTYRGSNYTVRIYVDGSAIGNSGYSYAWTRSSNVNAPNGYSSTCRDADANSYTMSCVITETATGDTYNLPLLTLNITKKQLTASGTTVSDKLFDGTTTATVTTSISGISNSEVTVTPTATFPDIHKGEDQEVTVVYSFNAGTAANQSNYILPPTETKTATIEPRPVTISNIQISGN